MLRGMLAVRSTSRTLGRCGRLVVALLWVVLASSCKKECTDEEVFRWLSAYDQCLSPRPSAEAIRSVGAVTAVDYCQKLFRLPAGITDAQIRRYRLLNPGSS